MIGGIVSIHGDLADPESKSKTVEGQDKSPVELHN